MGIFSRRPVEKRCFFCSAYFLDEPLAQREHYETHLRAVTDNNGFQAYTFECPRCGLMDLAWGGGRSDPKGTAANAMKAHHMQRHSIFDR
jgi:hypothetical protein